MRGVVPGIPFDDWRGVCFWSSSKSSNTTTTTTQQFDERVAATDSAVVVQLEGGSVLELTDPGAVEAFNAAVGAYEEIVNTALGFAGQQNERANALAREVLEKNRTEQAQALTDLLKWGAVISIGIVAAVQAPRFFKG